MHEDVVVMDPTAVETDAILNKTSPEPVPRNLLIGTYVKGGFINDITPEFEAFLRSQGPAEDGEDILEGGLEVSERVIGSSFEELTFMTNMAVLDADKSLEENSMEDILSDDEDAEEGNGVVRS